jgi:hypothetical protein
MDAAADELAEPLVDLLLRSMAAPVREEIGLGDRGAARELPR